MLSSVPHVVDSLEVIDAKFAWDKQPSVMLNVLKSLMAADPHDRDTHGYNTFKWISPRLKSWEAVQEKCRQMGTALAKCVFDVSP